MKKNGQSGFTFIELLIVIALLAALVGLILPGMNANKGEALDDVCGYNQAGTVRTLLQYAQAYNKLPDQFHTGLASNGVTTAAGLMNVPDATRFNVTNGASATIGTLDAEAVASLRNAGVTGLAYGTGYSITEVTTNNSPSVLLPNADWYADGDGSTPFTIKFRSVDEAESSGTGLGGAGEIIALFVTPTMDWDATDVTGAEDYNGYGQDIGLEVKIDLEGRCPIPPSTIDFTYYMAFVKAFDDGSAAKLVAVSCPECGLINP
jgi:prepilin-type N-terminal cleavage/methylation domain-containing protein